jgi:protein CSF1
MFLPKPRLPSLSLHDQMPAGIRAHRNSRRSHPNLGSLGAVESDEDEHVSEADRDARLAFVDSFYRWLLKFNVPRRHSRPTTPLMFNKDYEDRSMSSSDESDNDITSDSSNSDSDEAEHDECTDEDMSCTDQY